MIDALRLLPVQPLKERDELGRARYAALRRGCGEGHANSVRLPDLEELFLEVDGSAPRISREGARLLLELYHEGVFETSLHRDAAADVDLLEAYAQGRASILGLSYWPRPRQQRRKVSAEPAKGFEQGRHSITMYSTEREWPIRVHRLT